VIFGAVIKQGISLGMGQNMLTRDHVKTEQLLVEQIQP